MGERELGNFDDLATRARQLDHIAMDAMWSDLRACRAALAEAQGQCAALRAALEQLRGRAATVMAERDDSAATDAEEWLMEAIRIGRAALSGAAEGHLTSIMGDHITEGEPPAPTALPAALPTGNEEHGFEGYHRLAASIAAAKLVKAEVVEVKDENGFVIYLAQFIANYERRGREGRTNG